MSQSRYLISAALLVALVQMGILGSMIYGRASILRSGQEAVLEVRPVDPRDLLRGEYVSLAYNISMVPAALFEKQERDDPVEMVVYVRLRPGEDGIAQPVAARFAQPPQAPLGEREMDVRGIAWNVGGTLAHDVAVDYGIERFYLPEGEGRAIEENLRERSFRMKIAVADDGAAQIKAFYDGDTLIYAEPLY